MDANLLDTIKYIKQLAEQNKEFKKAMMELFRENSSKPMLVDDERISQIAQYLGLDVHVDNMGSTIDYSFVSEEDTRNKLISDNREMVRFRYGTRYHKTIFEEFCRYAQFQVEMLLNYYYKKTDGTLDKIKIHLKYYNDSKYHKKIDESKTLHGMTFNSKYWAFANEFNLMKIIDVLDYVSRVRNSQSHRSPQEDSFSIVDFRKKLKNYQIKLLDDGSINWTELYKNSLAKNLFETKIKNTPDYSNYLFDIWLNKTPYEDITDTLKAIANCVKDHTSSV